MHSSLQWAGGAARLRARTDRGPEVHDRLRIRFHLRVRGTGLSVAPEQLLGHALVGGSCDSKQSRQHALDVAVQNGRAPTVRERDDRCRRGTADPRQPHEQLRLVRQLTLVLPNDLLRGLMQMARARVVPQSGPQVQHLIERRTRQRLDGRKALHEARVIPEHRRDLRLLQHDLRHPHAIRRAFALPWQVMPPIARVPGDQRRRNAPCVRLAALGAGIRCGRR